MKIDNRIQSPYLAAMQERVLVMDGAMGTNLATQNLTSRHFGGEQFNGCNDYLSVTYPQAVEKVHRSFLDTGVDIIESNTFRSNRQTLAEFGLQEQTADINLAAARLARRLADEYARDGRPRFVAGAMGPTGKLLSLRNPDEEPMDFDTASAIFREQASYLIEGGADFMLLETQQDILEVKAAIVGIHQAFAECGKVLPIQAQVTLDTNGRMLLGTDIQAVLSILEGMGINVVGLNCSTGPEHMRAPLGYLAAHAQLPVSVKPNAGMPINSEGGATYPLGPQDFAEQVSSFVADLGVNVVGGCCGTTVEHLRLLIERLKDTQQKKRQPEPIATLSSAFQACRMQQEPAPFIIGERLNTQGSRAFKRLMLADDYDSAARLAAEQVENGAHALDICTAMTEDQREGERMQQLATLLSAQINAPLVIDSTVPEVMERGLKAAPGRCLINSVHLEAGEEKARRIMGLAREHNAALIALTIDENGMAKTADEKLAVAKRIYRLAVEDFGFKPQDLVFDPLTFTLGSGSSETLDAGIQTLDAIHAIKRELPGVFTSLGLSNISFGLNPPARAVLNTVMLYHSVQAGLDMAILNPAQFKAYSALDEREKQLAEDLLFNHHPEALAEYTSYFLDAKAEEQTSQSAVLDALPVEERIRQRILTRKKDGLIEDLDAAIRADQDSANKAALRLINEVLLPAMQEIGEQFGRGELILPFVLQSAELMRAASNHLEQFLEKDAAAAKGKLILATVYGDVHDIGKNLVKTILSNNGYDVVDLGKQVPVETIVRQAVEQQADAIGLSALLVSTSQQMPLVVDALQEQNLRLPVLIGGAAVNPEFAERIGRKDGKAYAGGVYYCADAFAALKALDMSKNGQTPAEKPDNGNSGKKSNVAPTMKTSVQRADIPAAEVPQAPFQGARVLPSLPLADLFERLNRSALFRISWGVKNAKGEKWEKYQRDFTQRLEQMRADAFQQGWLNASAAYGYFPCNAEGDDLIVYNPLPDGGEEPLRFPFPRQTDDKGLCLSDYFRPAGSGQRDLAIFQIVTLGQRTADSVQALHEADDFTESFFAHGLAVQLTESAAGYLHDHIRRELGLGARQGKRYSWGYPAIPDLSQHELVFKLLPAHEKLGLSLTSAYQFVPEYTTAALVLHHPQASYFQVKTE
ncbi:MAG: 5-methyltetrahydrofolate--homocysteine methyltransferase [Chloroflexota bacterium]|nr:5-methyltetrahydrofolate--homocysteine methyltransferase [Chloroflexota bacterium]